MGEINLDRVNSLAGEIRKATQSIESLLKLSQNEVISNANNLGSLKYYLIVAIQAAIDICYHVVAQKGTTAPQNYGDCFKSLAEMGILEKDLGTRLADMVKFRNLLIHLYWQVDNSRVYKTAKENVDDFELFIKSLARLDV